MPPNMEPAAHKYPGKNTSKTFQCLPRTAKDLQEHIVEYELLKDCFEEIFEYTRQMVFSFL